MTNNQFTAKWVTELADQWITELNMKRLETGYADNQPKWPYWVRPYNYDEQDWYDIDKWLLDTMGDSNWFKEDARWVGSDRKYWFRDERDRTLFILRWSV
jgi:hypothetical protein